MRQITCKVTGLKRKTNTRLGNPRYVILTENYGSLATEPDAYMIVAITERLIGSDVCFTLNENNKVTDFKVLD